MRMTLALLISHVRVCPEKLSVTIPKNIKKNEGCATAERYVPKVLRYMAVPGENQRPVASHRLTNFIT